LSGPQQRDDMSDYKTGSDGDESLRQVIGSISRKAAELESESRRLRRLYQTFTVLTILLGVSAPAVVTYTAPAAFEVWWKLFAIVVTAFATASATIRTVLRFSERYSNSALTSIALLDLEAQVQARHEDVLTTVKDEFREQKLFEVSAWARKQMFEIVKSYVEKDVSALTQERIALVEPPKIEEHQKIDNTKR
jgi:hypothetical protein